MSLLQLKLQLLPKLEMKEHVPRFPSFRFVYRSNRKLANLRNFPFFFERYILTFKILCDLFFLLFLHLKLQLLSKFEVKENFPRFSVLFIGPNRKLGNLGKFYFTTTFSSLWNPRSKNQKDLRQKMMWLNKKNMKIFEISEFSIWPYEQNWKPGNLWKFSFALNFGCFDCI